MGNIFENAFLLSTHVNDDRSLLKKGPALDRCLRGDAACLSAAPRRGWLLPVATEERKEGSIHGERESRRGKRNSKGRKRAGTKNKRYLTPRGNLRPVPTGGSRTTSLHPHPVHPSRH